MTVLHLAGSLSRQGAGLYYCLQPLCRHLARAGMAVQPMGCWDSEFANCQSEWTPLQPKVFRASTPLRVSFPLAQAALSNQSDLLHLHGLWLFQSLIACRWQRRGRRLVISPHGMLEPWAWRNKAWKKRPVWWLWERRNLAKANLIHATSAMEAQNIRALGIRTPIAVIPNGVEMPDQLPPKPSDSARTRQALFISRLHPKKGLLNLVQAWAQVRPQGWRMVVAGPDENQHQAEVQRAVHQAGLQDVFNFPGPVHGQDKFKLYASSDLFVLPTFSENFGLVIAEALSCGTPVITTTGTPWKELEENQCGWWIKPDAEALAKTLNEAIALSDADRVAMGQRGRILVREKYAWPKIATDMKAIYEWVLGSGSLPASVRLD